MSEISLLLHNRTKTRKQVAKLRHEGLIPSVVYGGKTKVVITESPIVETTKVVHAAGKHTPVRLTIDGKKKLAMIKRIDVDPVKHRVRHISFHAVKQNEAITAEVPIVLKSVGESEAEKAGLLVLQALEKIEIKALPSHLPEALELSIASLASTDDKLTLADISLPEGVEYADAEQNTELVIANVYEPSALQAANESAGGEAEDESGVIAKNGGDVEPEEGEMAAEAEERTS